MVKKKMRPWTNERADKAIMKQYGASAKRLEDVKNGDSPIKILLPCGHIAKKRPRDIEYGKGLGCKECTTRKALLRLYIEMVEVLTSEGCKVTDSFEDFVKCYNQTQKPKKLPCNTNVPLNYICPNGERHHLIYTIFKKGYRCPCKKCKATRGTKPRKPYACYKSVSEVNAKIESMGKTLQIIAKEWLGTQYNGRHVKYPVKCTVCGETDTAYGNDLLYGTRDCRYCNGRKGSLKQLIEWQKKNRPDQQVLEGQEYANMYTPVYIKCTIHNEVYQQTPNSFKRGRCSCPQCKHIQRSDISQSMHEQYDQTNPLTPLQKYLREQLAQWKLDSFQATNYKCFITGKGGTLEVHHVDKPFNIIVKESVEQLNFPIYETIGEYTEEQLDAITKKVLSEHKLGIPLTPELHKEYHSRYGCYENVNRNTFIEFIRSVCPDNADELIAKLP